MLLMEMASPKEEVAKSPEINFANPAASAINLISHIINQAATKRTREAAHKAERKVQKAKVKFLTNYLGDKERQANKDNATENQRYEREQGLKEAIEAMKRKESARDYGLKRDELLHKRDQFYEGQRFAAEKANMKETARRLEEERKQKIEEEKEDRTRKKDYYYNLAKQMKPASAKAFLENPENLLDQVVGGKSFQSYIPLSKYFFPQEKETLRLNKNKKNINVGWK